MKTEGLRPLFKIEKGEWFNEKKIRKGFEKAREVYGSARLFRVHGRVPDTRSRTIPSRRRRRRGAADGAGPPPPPSAGRPGRQGEQPSRSSTSRCGWRKASSTSSTASSSSATRRRATTSSGARSGCSKDGVFNTEALKYSVRRLNQLGYFKPLEGEAIDVQKTPERGSARSTSG